MSPSIKCIHLDLKIEQFMPTSLTCHDLHVPQISALAPQPISQRKPILPIAAFHLPRRLRNILQAYKDSARLNKTQREPRGRKTNKMSTRLVSFMDLASSVSFFILAGMSFNYTFGSQDSDNQKRKCGGETEGEPRKDQASDDIVSGGAGQENWAETDMAFAISYLTLGLD